VSELVSLSFRSVRSMKPFAIVKACRPFRLPVPSRRYSVRHYDPVDSHQRLLGILDTDGLCAYECVCTEVGVGDSMTASDRISVC
jgi:hypothetical protein